jgi:hypothetical protein
LRFVAMPCSELAGGKCRVLLKPAMKYMQDRFPMQRRLSRAIVVVNGDAYLSKATGMAAVPQ